MGLKPRKAASGQKSFLFLTIGFERPTPAAMSEWHQWFETMSDRIVDQGGLWSGGRELSSQSTNDLPFGKDSITGYLIFEARSLDEAETLAGGCPVVLSNQLYEIMRR